MNNNSKFQIRKRLREERSLVSLEDRKSASEKIIFHLISLVNDAFYRRIFVYYETKHEIPVRHLMFGLGSDFKFGLPYIVTNTIMVFKKYDLDALVIKNRYGILEPIYSSTTLNPNKETLVVVPCVGVNKEKYRLGNGGGYYDRFMSKNTESTYVGVVYDQHSQISFPVESHDQKLDYVVTEKGIR